MSEYPSPTTRGSQSALTRRGSNLASSLSSRALLIYKYMSLNKHSLKYLKMNRGKVQTSPSKKKSVM